MNLYKVTLQGMQWCIVTPPPYGISYVIAKDPTDAYETVKKLLDEKDIGFSYERELKSVELIAGERDYGVPFRLHIAKGVTLSSI